MAGREVMPGTWAEYSTRGVSIALASLLGDFQTSMRVAVVLAWVVVVA